MELVEKLLDSHGESKSSIWFRRQPVTSSVLEEFSVQIVAPSDDNADHIDTIVNVYDDIHIFHNIPACDVGMMMCKIYYVGTYQYCYHICTSIDCTGFV